MKSHVDKVMIEMPTPTKADIAFRRGYFDYIRPSFFSFRSGEKPKNNPYSDPDLAKSYESGWGEAWLWE